MDFTVGMLIVHPARPEWGPGKVLKVSGNKVDIAFKYLPAGEIKKFCVDIAGLVAAEDQLDPAFDQVGLSNTGKATSGAKHNKPKNVPGRNNIPKNWTPANMVLSVPVGETGHFVGSYRVHACPDNFSYRPTEYLTFRKSGGFMSEMFRINDNQTLVLDPFDDAAINLHVSEHFFDRLKGYIGSRRRQQSFSNEPYRFYILNEDNVTSLPHKPAMLANSQGHCYFTADDLTSGSKIVTVASSKNP